MQTLSQRRAAKALELLSKIPNDDRDKFSQFCKSFPTMVLQNGLGQALAFIKAKARKTDGRIDERYENLYTTLNGWLNHLKLIEGDMLRQINEMDARKYIEIQRESLRFLEWVKRYENAGIFFNGRQ